MRKANLKKPVQRSELTTAVRSCYAAFVVVALFSMVINALMLATPIYMLQVYDRVLSTGRLETLYFLTVLAGFALLFMCSLDSLRTSITVRVGGLLTKRLGPVFLACGVRARLKGDNTGGQSLRDLTQIQNFVGTQGLSVFFDSPWVPAFVFVIWLLHPWLGMLALASAIVLLALSVINEYATREPTKVANVAQIAATRQAEAAIRNAEVVQAMGMLPAMVGRWRMMNQGALEAMGTAGERSGILVATTKFVRFFAQICILGLGALLVIGGELTAGGMIAGSILLSRALAPVELAIGAWRNCTSARLAYGRLKTQLEAYPSIPERIELPEPEGRVSVEGLTNYAAGTGEPILKKVSFEVEPGEAVAVLGPSGAGKSTLCRFLVNIAQPNGGEVRLDGSVLGHWDDLQLGRHIGYLPQDVELFAGTVRENIARMARVDDKAVIDAAVLAHAHEMIQQLAQGYETEIGDGGVGLSGGQRQRIGLARAVYGRPRLIVLDEPNANLDQIGESALSAAIGELKAGGSALIIVGHRPSTLAEADKVLLLQDGIVKIFGPREDVLQMLRKSSSAEPPEKRADVTGDAAQADDAGAIADRKEQLAAEAGAS